MSSRSASKPGMFSANHSPNMAPSGTWSVWNGSAANATGYQSSGCVTADIPTLLNKCRQRYDARPGFFCCLHDKQAPADCNTDPHMLAGVAGHDSGDSAMLRRAFAHDLRKLDVVSGLTHQAFGIQAVEKGQLYAVDLVEGKAGHPPAIHAGERPPAVDVPASHVRLKIHRQVPVPSCCCR